MSIDSHVFQQWLDGVMPADRHRLIELSNDDRLFKDSFYRNLEFGTGGLRGTLGIGPNRMNVYTVAKATQGLSVFLKKRYGVGFIAIARDCRKEGDIFVHVAASVLKANGFDVLAYPRIEPTPTLSFAVRYLNCIAGICITASHNPAEYNGYKVYDKNGCQITTDAAKEIQAEIDAVDIMDPDLLSIVNDACIRVEIKNPIKDEVLDRYIEACVSYSSGIKLDTLNVVYTPLHGTGLECISKIFEVVGYSNLAVDPLQSTQDGDFPTCPFPNPEIPEAMERGLMLTESLNADLLIATDPDADRVGVGLYKNGKPILLTGNEIGILLVDFLCNIIESRGENLHEKVVISTIVSSSMVEALSKDRGFELRRTLTGFKYIGEQIGLLEEQGEIDRFLFGFEESYGYLVGNQVRDKDGIVSSLLIAEMAQWYKSKNMDLVDALHSLYARYGFYKNEQISISYPGMDGAIKMAQIMESLRLRENTNIGEFDVVKVVDYKAGALMPVLGGTDKSEKQVLPAADVLEFRLTGDNKVIIRPSGTEPKIKVYLFARGIDEYDVNMTVDKLSAAIYEMLS